MRYERHIFVCTNQREPDAPRGSCGAKGSAEIRDRLKQMVKEAGLKSVVRINASGCLDACEFGPVAVSYPDGRWYGDLHVADCEQFMEEEVLAGRGMSEKLIDHPKFDPARPVRRPGTSTESSTETNA